jgi:hypothetical protein
MTLTEWAIRMFGSLDAYQRTLPTSEWIQGGSGWYSAVRK